MYYLRPVHFTDFPVWNVCFGLKSVIKTESTFGRIGLIEFVGELQGFDEGEEEVIAIV